MKFHHFPVVSQCSSLLCAIQTYNQLIQTDKFELGHVQTGRWTDGRTGIDEEKEYEGKKNDMHSVIVELN